MDDCRLVLYMIYYPPHLKYATITLDAHDSRPPQHVQTNIKQDEWRLSITLSWVVLLYTFVPSPSSSGAPS